MKRIAILAIAALTVAATLSSCAGSMSGHRCQAQRTNNHLYRRGAY